MDEKAIAALLDNQVRLNELFLAYCAGIQFVTNVKMNESSMTRDFDKFLAENKLN